MVYKLGLMFLRNANTISECCNEYVDMQEGYKSVGNYLLKVVNLVTENVFMNVADLSSFYFNTFFPVSQVSSWGGYVFLINLIPLHVLALMITGRFSHRIYVAYCSVSERNSCCTQIYMLKVRVTLIDIA